MEFLYGRTYAEAQNRQIPNSLITAANDSLQIFPSDRVLEIGSGNGLMLSHLQNYSPHSIGLDINHFAPNTLGAVKGDARQMPFKDGSFNKVLSLHTLEHIDDLHSVFQEMDRVMAQGGLAFHLFPANLITKAEGAIFDAIRMNGVNLIKAWKDAHRLHVHKLNPRKIQEFAQKTSLNIVDYKRYFVPEGLSVSWGVLLEKE